MKSLFCLVLLLSAISTLQASKVTDTLKACQSNDVESCHLVEGKKIGGADNAFCVSLPPSDPEYTDSVFATYCGIGSGCFKPATLTGANVTKVIGKDYLKVLNSLGGGTVGKVGKGLRRDMMDPTKYGAWACQTWSQLSGTNNKAVFESDGFVYLPECNTCILVTGSNELEEGDYISGAKFC